MDSSTKMLQLGAFIQSTRDIIKRRNEAEAEFQKRKENLRRELAACPELKPLLLPLYQRMRTDSEPMARSGLPNHHVGPEATQLPVDLHGPHNHHVAPEVIQPPMGHSGSLNQHSEDMQAVDLQQFLGVWVPDATPSKEPKVGSSDQISSMAQGVTGGEEKSTSQSKIDFSTDKTCIIQVPVCYNCYQELSRVNQTSEIYLVDQNLVESRATDIREEKSKPITITLSDSKLKSKTTYTFTFVIENSTFKSYYFQVRETTIHESGSVENKENRRQLTEQEFFSIKGKLSDPNRRHLRRKARYYAEFIAAVNNPPTSSSHHGL